MKSLLVIICTILIQEAFASSNDSSSVYYPLEIGNRWEFSGPLAKAVKESLFVNGKKYTMIFHSNSVLGSVRIERFENNKVYRFNQFSLKDELWFDFNRKAGDTVNVIPIKDDTLTIRSEGVYKMPVLFSQRSSWLFVITSQKNKTESAVMIADSIGLYKYYPVIMDDNPYNVTSAIINAKQFRQNSSYFYFPLTVGNYWVFNFGFGKMSVTKDTLMPNGKKYVKVESTVGSWLGGTFFLRQENNIVWRYSPVIGSEEIEIDLGIPGKQDYELSFTRSGGHLIVTTATGKSKRNVFSSERSTYTYLKDLIPYIDDEEYITCAEGIGFIKIDQAFGGYTIWEAFIDGVLYKTANAENAENVPSAQYLLEQNYPNPFNPLSTIQYAIPELSRVRLSIVNVLGQVVSVSEKGVIERGSYKHVVDASNLPSGLYFYRLEAVAFHHPEQKTVLTKKMMLIR